MGEYTEYTIGEAAAMLGVTTKTLRHWEARGLLDPWRTAADYRVYTDHDIERGAAIALYRGVGMPLGDIAKLIDAPSHTLRTALTRHRALLADQLAAVSSQLEAVDALIEESGQSGEGVINMDAMKKYLGEKMPEYQAEAEQRWGDTREWAQSQEKLAQMGENDFAALQREHEGFVAELKQAQKDGVAAGSEEAKGLVDKHRALIGRWYEVTPSRQLILARMYVGDVRFHESYGGTQDYLLGLVEAQAAAEGVDMDNPQW